MTLSVLFPQNGVTWAAVGHTTNRDPDAGNLNSFGRAFQSAGFVSLTMVTRLTYFQEVPLAFFLLFCVMANDG